MNAGIQWNMLQGSIMKPSHFLVALAAVAAAAAAYAQAPLGTVTSVNGVVSATVGATAVVVRAGAPIVNGTRFIASSGSSVTLTMGNGCTVSVPAGHGVTVTQGMTCPQLVAAVQPVVAIGPAPLLSSPGFVPALVVIGGAGLAAAALAQGSDKNDAPLSAK